MVRLGWISFYTSNKYIDLHTESFGYFPNYAKTLNDGLYLLFQKCLLATQEVLMEL